MKKKSVSKFFHILWWRFQEALELFFYMTIFAIGAVGILAIGLLVMWLPTLLNPWFAVGSVPLGIIVWLMFAMAVLDKE